MLELVERHSTGKARLLRLLDEVAAEGWCERTLYLTPNSLEARTDAGRSVHPAPPDSEVISIVAQVAGKSDTGLALFIDRVGVAIYRPFSTR